MRIVAIIILTVLTGGLYLMKRKEMDKQLSENFNLWEFVKTSVPVPNIPGEKEQRNIQRIVDEVLQPLRNREGALIVTSGYRNDIVNKAVGGVPGSAHKSGLAVDVKPRHGDFKKVVDSIKSMNLPVEKVIWEKKGMAEWIHIEQGELGSNPSGSFLTADYDDQAEKMNFEIYNG